MWFVCCFLFQLLSQQTINNQAVDGFFQFVFRRPASVTVKLSKELYLWAKFILLIVCSSGLLRIMNFCDIVQFGFRTCFIQELFLNHCFRKPKTLGNSRYLLTTRDVLKFPNLASKIMLSSLDEKWVTRLVKQLTIVLQICLTYCIIRHTAGGTKCLVKSVHRTY